MRGQELNITKVLHKAEIGRELEYEAAQEAKKWLTEQLKKAYNNKIVLWEEPEDYDCLVDYDAGDANIFEVFLKDNEVHAKFVYLIQGEIEGERVKTMEYLPSYSYLSVAQVIVENGLIKA